MEPETWQGDNWQRVACLGRYHLNPTFLTEIQDYGMHLRALFVLLRGTSGRSGSTRARHGCPTTLKGTDCQLTRQHGPGKTYNLDMLLGASWNFPEA